MAIAGRVAIIPKGEWSQDVTYDKLDLVTHGGNAYIAYKSSTNVEPVDGDIWMLIMESVSTEDVNKLKADTEAILNGTTLVGDSKKLGGNLPEYFATAQSVTDIEDGTTPVAKAKDADTVGGYGADRITVDPRTDIVNRFYNTLGDHTYITYVDETVPNVPFTSNYLYFIGMNASGQVQSAIAVGIDYCKTMYVYNALDKEWKSFLPLTGGTLSGKMESALDALGKASYFGANGCAYVEAWNNAFTACRQLAVRNTDGTPDDTYGIALVNTLTGAIYDVLHSGNKPTGSYTGNGDATSRTISTGGIGNAVLIFSSNGFSILTPSGAIARKGEIIETSNNSFLNGVITLNTEDANYNATGVTYYYQVL